MDSSTDASARLSDRFPAPSALTGLVGQLKDGMGGVKVPEISGDKIQSLASGLKLPIPDTSSWHAAIPDDAKNLTANFPDPSTLAAPITEPIGKVSDVFSFDFAKFQQNQSTPPPSAPSAVTAAPSDVASTLESLVAPVDEVAKLLADPELARILEVLGSLTGSQVFKEVPQKAEEATANIKSIVHDKVEAFLLAFTSLVSAHSSQELLRSRVTTATGTFSLSDTQSRLLAVIDQYNGSTTLAAMIAAADGSNAAAMAALKDRLNQVSGAFQTYTGSMVRDLALTELALATLDVSDLQPQWLQMKAAVSRVDWSAANTLATSIATEAQKLKDKISVDTGFTIDQYKEAIQTGIVQLDAMIDKFDISRIVTAIQEFFKVLLSPLKKVEDFKTQVETIIRGALGTIQEAVQKINLKPLVDTVKQALATLSNSLKQVAALLKDVRDTIQSALNTVKSALDGVKTFVLDPKDGLKKKIEDVFNSINSVLDALKIQDVVNEIQALLKPVNDALAKIEFQPVINAVLNAISDITGVLKTLGPLLVTDALKQKLAEAAAFLAQIDFGKIGDTLNGTFNEILASVDQDALGAFQAEYQQVVDSLKNFDPEPALQEAQKDVFEPLLDELKKVHPADLLKPVAEAFGAAHEALAKFNPTDTFSFMTDFFKDLIAKIDGLSPAKMLAPVEKMLDDLRTQINTLLHIDQIVAGFQTFKTWAQPAIAGLDLFGPILAALAPGFSQLSDTITNFDGSVFTKVIANLMDGALAKLGALVNASGLSAALAAVSAGEADLGAALAAMQQAMTDSSASLAGLDAQGALTTLRGLYSQVKAALAARTGPALPDDVTSLINALDPMPVIAPILPKIDRVKAAAASTAAQFGQSVGALADVLKSLGPALSLLQTLFSPMTLLRDAMMAPVQGLFPGKQFSGPKELVLYFLDQLNPAELQPILQPLFTTIEGKLKALVDDAVLNPVGEAVQTLQGATEILNIHSLVDAITGVFKDVEGVIQSLDPTPLIQDIDADYKQLTGLLDAVDPSQFILEIAKTYDEDIVGVIQSISPEALLLPPLRELFQKLSADLGAFNIQAIFKPVLDRLKTMDSDLGDGLHKVEGAWTQMLGVLSSTTDGAASASVGG